MCGGIVLRIFVFLSMIFLHIFDDYTLQGCLADLKQRKWWEIHAPDSKYRYDYLMALLMHSMSWSFMIMLPIAAYHKFNVDFDFAVMFAINTVLHGIVDHCKCNEYMINLIEDQTFHIFQIAITFICLMLITRGI